MVQITSHKYGIQGVGISKQGGRPENQDDLGFSETPLGFLLVVCDGMGGGPGGKTASYIVKNAVLDTMANSSAMATPADVLKMAVDKANNAIEEKVAQMPQLKGMGSTLVALLITEEQAIVAHLGDSRCYRLHNGKMAFRTDDHSLVGELVRHGALTEEQARTSPQSNVITRGLGNTANHVAEIHEVPYRTGDRFVLCTDGVWGIMSNDDLLRRFSCQGELDSIAKNLSEEIDKIGESNGNNHDNHTMIIVEMGKDSIIKDPMNKSTKFLLYGGLLALLVSAIFNIVSLVRFGASPQIDNLKFVNDSLNNSITNLTIRMQAEKESYNAQIDSIINNSENVTQKERAVAQREKDLLNETIREQQFCIDSLRRVIRTIQRQTGVCRQESVIVGKDEKDGMSALQLAGYCIDVFNAFKNAKETAKASLLENSKALSAKLNAYKDDVIETLSILDKKTEGKYIKEIRVILHDLNRSKYFKPETVIWKSDNNRGVYTSLDAKKLIDKFIIPTLEKIVDAEK